jgi:hypothetical protein
VSRRGDRSERGGGGRGTSALDGMIDGALQRYSRGDLDGALDEWRRVLTLDPQNRRAESYVRYVEEHYELLVRHIAGGGRLVEGELADGSQVLVIEAYSADEDAAELGYEEMEVALDEEGEAGRSDDLDLGLGPAGGPVLGGGRASTEIDVGRARTELDRSRPPALEVVDSGWSLTDGWTAEMASEPGTALRGATRAETEDPTREHGGARPPSHGDPWFEKSTTDGVVKRRRPSLPDALNQAAHAGDDAIDLPSWSGRAGTATESADFDLSELGLGAPATSPRTNGGDVRVSFRSPARSVSEPAPRPLAPVPSAMEQPSVTLEIDAEPPPLPPVDLRIAAGASDGISRSRRRSSRDGAEDELTIERRSQPPWPSSSRTASPAPAPSGPDEALLTFEEVSDHQTLSPPPAPADAPGDEESRESTGFFERASGRRASSSRGGLAGVSLAELRDAMKLDLDAAVASGDDDDSVRRRLTWLMDRARNENQRRHHSTAVVAVDLALDERPDSATAQKLIHRNRDLLFEVYRDFLGDLGSIPALAIRLEELATRAIDHRAAFLLTRIDGSLSFEDLLDIAGMPRLEAYRHLSRLMLEGILHVG